MVIQRGEIWWADLEDPAGSGPGFRHPVVVVQSDRFNRTAIRTVIVALITSNMPLGAAPGNLVVTPEQTGLPRVSVINNSQVVTIDKAELSERVGRLPAAQIAALDEGLRLVLSL